MSVYVESSKKGGKKSADKSQKIVEEAKPRFKAAYEGSEESRRLFVEDMEFRVGEQWPDNVKSSRQIDNRPCLVINKTPQAIQQITNDQRQNRPSIKVNPIDDHGDIETAKVIQGLIRHIEYNSNADVAYDRAFEPAATGGFGYYRFTTGYVDHMSFDQEIRFASIPDPLCVYFDPHSQEPDGSDANWAFIVDKMSRDEFEMTYPDAELSKAGHWEMYTERNPDWVEKDTVQVAEYFYKETVRKKLLLLSDGESVFEDEIDDQLLLLDDVTVVSSRMTDVPRVKWCKINGCEVLEETEWPGKYIPIVPVYGNEIFIKGKRHLEGIVRNVKDSQRMYNYWASAETEAIALAPKTPFIAAEGQLEGYENDWATANSRNHSVLVYKPTTVGGSLAPPPQRNAFEPAVNAITQARMLASEDMKATTGIYDASLGAQSNETSGVAIQRRNHQAQTSNFHFVDNLTRSLRHGGRILIDLIPKIYDTKRTARIIGEEGEEKIVQLNAPFEEKGKEMIYQLDVGRYDVAVDVGPSFASKRQEAVTSMLEVIRAYPQLAGVASDLLVKNMDWPGAQEISERLKKTLPPGLAESDDDKAEIPPEVQAQMQQMSQMVEQLTAKLNEANEDIKTKKIELDSKERIEMKKLEVELEIERAKLDAKDGLALLNAEISQLNQEMQKIGTHDAGGESAMASQVPQPQPTGGFSPGTSMGSEP